MLSRATAITLASGAALPPAPLAPAAATPPAAPLPPVNALTAPALPPAAIGSAGAVVAAEKGGRKKDSGGLPSNALDRLAALLRAVPSPWSRAPPPSFVVADVLGMLRLAARPTPIEVRLRPAGGRPGNFA